MLPKPDKEDRMLLRAELETALGADELSLLEQMVKAERSKPPKVAIIGKSGVGKTTTINSLFRTDWKTSDTVAGTKNAQMEEFSLPNGFRLSVVDMPGLGEDIDSDELYETMYRNILPGVDVVLWVIQANAKDLSEDQRILNDVVLTCMRGLERRIVVGLNQVDKIGPGGWNERLNYPSPEQQVSIARRCEDIIAKLSRVTPVSKQHIVYYSALRCYLLPELMTAMINAAGDLGWKFPTQPADPLELADPEVREFARMLMRQKGE